MKLKKFREVFNRHPIIFSIILYALYTSCFFLTERFNTREAFLIHSYLDDLIPFGRFAVIPYCLWFPEIAITLLYVYYFKDEDEFFRDVFLPLILMFCSLPIYYLFPTEINLRPATVPGSDIFATLTRFIYSVDDSRNVCPSIHVGVCFLMSDIWKRNTNRKTGIFMTILNAIISLSTLFLKQHSVIDVFAGLIYGFIVKTIIDSFVFTDQRKDHV